MSDFYTEEQLWEDIDTISEEDRATLQSSDAVASMDVMCSLCPNLERLHVNDGPFSDDFLRTPGSMMGLKHLEVTANDPEYGFHVDELASLFRAAPKLTSLCFAEASSNGDPQLTLNHVTRLYLDWCDLTAEAFVNVLRLCPNVERLRYVSGGFACKVSEPFTPRQAKEIIENALDLKKLKSFHLDMRQCVADAETCWPEEEVDVEAELKEAKEA